MNEIIPVIDFGINTGLNPITGVMFPGSGSEMDLLLLSFGWSKPLLVFSTKV